MSVYHYDRQTDACMRIVKGVKDVKDNNPWRRVVIACLLTVVFFAVPAECLLAWKGLPPGPLFRAIGLRLEYVKPLW